LFSGSADHTIRSWDILTGTPVRSFKGHQGSIIQIQVCIFNGVVCKEIPS